MGRTKMLRGDNLQKWWRSWSRSWSKPATRPEGPRNWRGGCRWRSISHRRSALLPRHIDPSEEDYVNCEWVDAPPGIYSSGVLALRVTGESMKPFMPPGTVVYYAERFDGGAPDIACPLSVWYSFATDVRWSSLCARATFTGDLTCRAITWTPSPTLSLPGVRPSFS